MRALVAAADQPSGVALAEVPDPTPSPHQAMVTVRAVSLNRGELNRLVSAPAGWRPGWDVAGEVLQPAADGSGPSPGCAVVGIVDDGGWAERVAVPTADLTELPEGLDPVTAAALPVAGLTALRTLRLGGLLLGRRVLITGAAGGVGRLAIQLAHQAGATVTAVVGRPERGDGLPALGADRVVVGMDALEAPDHDLVLESVGGESLAASLRLVAPGGTVVSFGNSSRSPTTFLANDLYAASRTLAGYFIFSDVRRERAAADLRRLGDMVVAGTLDPQVRLVVDWREAGEALAALAERRLDGKAVLRIAG